MIETLVALTFAHAMADFVLQSDWLVAHKRRPQVLLLHVAIVAAASWIAIGFAPVWGPLALIAGSHLLIDAAKLRWGGQGFTGFALDQAAHLVMVLAAALWAPGAYDEGLWSRIAAGPLPDLALLPAAMALAGALIFAVTAGVYAVASVMTAVTLPSGLDSLPKGGRTIGRLERLLILMLVLAGQPDGIGFLIAAKSILRFNELAGQPDRHVSEYVIIGTLASYAWAIAVGYAARGALQALGALPGA